MRYFPLIFLLLPLVNFAQTTFQLRLASKSGYEYNAFNQPKPPRTDSVNLSGLQIKYSVKISY